MFDETNVAEERAWHYRDCAQIAVKNLRRRQTSAYFAPSRQEALSLALDMIPAGALVGFGDSITLCQVGVQEALKSRGTNALLDPFERDDQGRLVVDGEERIMMMRQIFLADVYMAGANAVTLDGKIVNIDGRGNRVAPMIFGPRKVILVAGANKLTRNEEEALRRVHEVAAPLNAKRHYLKHHRQEFGDLPCVRSGLCSDCAHPHRICRYAVTIHGSMDPDRLHIILIGEELGL